ncbi:MAG: hypothetical protein FWG98_06185 [Candidatus Cloacimonetes bacterium]|nr:hypothetical protein [Candidatus Cloacimonadota bacterium]
MSISVKYLYVSLILLFYVFSLIAQNSRDRDTEFKFIEVNHGEVLISLEPSFLDMDNTRRGINEFLDPYSRFNLQHPYPSLRWSFEQNSLIIHTVYNMDLFAEEVEELYGQLRNDPRVKSIRMNIWYNSIKFNSQEMTQNKPWMPLLIKRWESENRILIAFIDEFQRSGTSIFIDPSVPYMPRTPQPQAFGLSYMGDFWNFIQRQRTINN